MSLHCPLPEICKDEDISSALQQCTFARRVSLAGTGLFTGEKATLWLGPGEPGTGIVFQRTDLPRKPIFPATLEYVRGTPRCTMIGHEGAMIQTVEHLLAALKAYQIDNAFIEVHGPEVPILDGSAKGFIELIERAGVVKQDERKIQKRLQEPVHWTQGETHLMALPSNEYRVSYTLHYPHSSFIGSQYLSLVCDEKTFKKEIAPARTFSLYEEIAPLIEKGFLKGGNLSNAVLIRDNHVVNPEGLRFSDEMVRHKILDLIGDLSLIGSSFFAHIIAIRSGHASNTAFGAELAKKLTVESA